MEAFNARPTWQGLLKDKQMQHEYVPRLKPGVFVHPPCPQSSMLTCWSLWEGIFFLTIGDIDCTTGKAICAKGRNFATPTHARHSHH